MDKINEFKDGNKQNQLKRHSRKVLLRRYKLILEKVVMDKDGKVM